MLPKSALALVAAVTLASQASALNRAHRHAHRRDLEHDVEHGAVPTEVVTRYASLTVTSSGVEAPTTLVTHTRSADPISTHALEKKDSSRGKRGVAYNDASAVNVVLNSAAPGKFGYAYNWDSNDNGLKADLSFVPMLWGPTDIHTSRWNANADAMIAKGASHLLSFNECDNVGQCNMAAADAAVAHVKWMNPYAGKAKIGAPAITNSNIPGEGLDWLRAFMSKCDEVNCAIDFCVTHWYNVPSAAQSLFDHVAAVSNICGGRSVWVTEFAPVEASDDDIVKFLPPVLDRLDASDKVGAYFYFFAQQGHLLADANTLSRYGKIYASN